MIQLTREQWLEWLRLLKENDKTEDDLLEEL